MSTKNNLNVQEEKAYLINKHVALKRNQEINNPCYKEQILSLKCLDSHNNHDECELYFTNYKNCRKFWATVQRERKLKNIKPYLPPVEERAKIKADYLNSR
ncbi:coiled-coil-helix-coiled-coil-helix domain-containing protein 7 [Odontomachus brunneus]|uniref:coiled-coil-helix-coiled-coil-helix domain-containing protein 7 n=1 Tax=Odontomachus brunneus TaxID=486640 RepID=UPI0013F29FE1|nr:coiled-coil-helix-coiled-coil-helix domain-containing protein 7 [Odontomachus brunneus]